MFTGIIEELGNVASAIRQADRMRFKIQAHKVLDDLKIDDSICVNGVCLTVIHVKNDFFEADAVEETLSRSTLTTLRRGEYVNLERALRPADRLGGHIVQGHVDAVGRIVAFDNNGTDALLIVELPDELLKYTIPKGSIAIDGISLTIAALSEHNITLAIIPHTLRTTALAQKRIGHTVNIEVDLIGKYIERLMMFNRTKKIMTEKWLNEMGF
ncbi:riboflavin synthase [candidate division KSB1 bacterium]|nr:riboflavin synthase [candidate division KSB1 bacterium]